MRFACVLLLVANTAYADKPTLGVLNVTAKDPFTGARAKQLTTAIRASAKGYQIKGTPKQVDAAILAAECWINEPACAAKLGAALDVEYTIAGELERRGKTDSLTLSLVDVKTKRRIRSLRDSSPSTADTRKWARRVVARLVDTEGGELVLAANAQNGEVWIDGQLVGALHQGRTTISGLANGTHQLVIKAKGYKPFEIDIDVDFSTKQSILLEPDR